VQHGVGQSTADVSNSSQAPVEARGSFGISPQVTWPPDRGKGSPVQISEACCHLLRPCRLLPDLLQVFLHCIYQNGESAVITSLRLIILIRMVLVTISDDVSDIA
jgi:hypothetical protein